MESKFNLNKKDKDAFLKVIDFQKQGLFWDLVSPSVSQSYCENEKMEIDGTCKINITLERNKLLWYK